MKRNSLFLSALTSATASLTFLLSISPLAHAATLNTQSSQAENKQLIAQSCGNTEIRLPNGQSQSWTLGSKWQTCNGYTLVLQKDGNLVLYSPTAVLWTTGTVGRGNAIALQRDGNVVLYDKNWKPIWATNTVGNSGAFLALQTDGNLVVYNSSGRPLWATNTVRPSQPSPPVISNRPLFPLGVKYDTVSKCLLGGICANVKNDKNEQTSHTGIDYFASSGSEVKAACDGTIWGQARTLKSTPNIWDRFTIIKHENCGGYSVLYGYYGHIDASVSVNQRVKRGDVIGKIGEWGSNSHLHLGFATKSFDRGWGYQVGDPLRNGWINPASLF
jgi:hypothetical protein